MERKGHHQVANEDMSSCSPMHSNGCISDVEIMKIKNVTQSNIINIHAISYPAPTPMDKSAEC